jgi:YfiH family protein
VADRVESGRVIQEIDELLAAAGLEHGRHTTRAGASKTGTPLKRSGDGKSGAGRQPEVVRVPGWDRLPWLRAGFSTRSGGVSEVYGGRTLNLGWTREDEAARVLENRERFAVEVAGKTAPLIGVRQIHSGLVRIVERDAEGELRAEDRPPGTTPKSGLIGVDGRPVLRGDGVMTDVPGVLLAVGVADCVPVLVADTRRKLVAAFHAGWRGTLARIVERGIGRMRLRYGSEVKDLVAAIGPAIGPCCYAVGEELRFEFESQFTYAAELFSEVYDSDPVREKYPMLFMTARAPGHSDIGPQIHLDLWEANRRQLIAAGLDSEAIWVARECTACTRMGEQLKYFSHRGESGFAGRGLGVIGRLE